MSRRGLLRKSVVGTCLIVLAVSAQAADPKKDGATVKGADAGSAQTGGGQSSAWVKICETAAFKAADGKEEQKKICLTHHERIDANTGVVLVSAAIRQIEGQTQPSLMLMVPLGMALPIGVQAKVDEEKDIFKMPFTVCHQGGCAAEMVATPEMIARMKAGKQLMVAAVNVGGTPLGFPVPLNGFDTAYDGAAMDSGKYAEARKKLMDVVRQRQAELGKAPPTAK